MPEKIRAASDHRKATSSKPYEVGRFARKHGISHGQARDFTRQIGNDRDRLNTAAAKLFRAQSCWQDLLVRVVLLLVDTRFQVGILRVWQERSAA